MTTKNNIIERMLELENELRNLEISFLNYQESDDKSHLLNISESLRNLVCSGGSSTPALLLNLSDELNVPLAIYSLPAKAKRPTQQLLLSLVGGRTWNTKAEDGLIEYRLSDWMDVPCYYIDESKQHFSRKQVIKNIADCNEETPYPTDSSAVQWQVNEKNYAGFASILLDVAPAILWLGNRFILLMKYKSLLHRNFLAPGFREQELKRILGAVLILDNQFERPN